MSPRKSCLGIMVAALLASAVSGCSKYENASSTTYDYAMALYSICNRRQADKIEAIAAKLESDRASGRLSNEEAAWLTSIVTQAKNGNWTTAASTARRILQDQAK